MKKTLICAICLIICETCVSQQNALYSQYMFNPFALNPAYAGSRQSTSAVLLYRNQWAGIDGAPVSKTFSIHTPMKGRRVALGFNVISDKIGPTNNIGAFGTYAYHLPLSAGNLSMALRAGFYRFQMNGELLDFKSKKDIKNDASVTSR